MWGIGAILLLRVRTLASNPVGWPATRILRLLLLLRRRDMRKNTPVGRTMLRIAHSPVSQSCDRL